MIPRNTPRTPELQQLAQQKPSTVAADRTNAFTVKSQGNSCHQRAREDWSARLIELMLSR